VWYALKQGLAALLERNDLILEVRGRKHVQGRGLAILLLIEHILAPKTKHIATVETDKRKAAHPVSQYEQSGVYREHRYTIHAV
jgi:hypothetical protein